MESEYCRLLCSVLQNRPWCVAKSYRQGKIDAPSLYAIIAPLIALSVQRDETGHEGNDDPTRNELCEWGE